MRHSWTLTEAIKEQTAMAHHSPLHLHSPIIPAMKQLATAPDKSGFLLQIKMLECFCNVHLMNTTTFCLSAL